MNVTHEGAVQLDDLNTIVVAICHVEPLFGACDESQPAGRVKLVGGRAVGAEVCLMGKRSVVPAYAVVSGIGDVDAAVDVHGQADRIVQPSEGGRRHDWSELAGWITLEHNNAIVARVADPELAVWRKGRVAGLIHVAGLAAGRPRQTHSHRRDIVGQRCTGACARRAAVVHGCAQHALVDRVTGVDFAACIDRHRRGCEWVGEGRRVGMHPVRQMVASGSVETLHAFVSLFGHVDIAVLGIDGQCLRRIKLAIAIAGAAARLLPRRIMQIAGSSRIGPPARDTVQSAVADVDEPVPIGRHAHGFGKLVGRVAGDTERAEKARPAVWKRLARTESGGAPGTLIVSNCTRWLPVSATTSSSLPSTTRLGTTARPRGLSN